MEPAASSHVLHLVGQPRRSHSLPAAMPRDPPAHRHRPRPCPASRPRSRPPGAARPKPTGPAWARCRLQHQPPQKTRRTQGHQQKASKAILLAGRMAESRGPGDRSRMQPCRCWATHLAPAALQRPLEESRVPSRGCRQSEAPCDPSRERQVCPRTLSSWRQVLPSCGPHQGPEAVSLGAAPWLALGWPCCLGNHRGPLRRDPAARHPAVPWNLRALEPGCGATPGAATAASRVPPTRLWCYWGGSRRTRGPRPGSA
mmetsp:Transcript_17767/g.48685  ORF Transcript_17767/g.48685 Transcript_17767/m.48685 type:complete len:257 (-) Transcript_17767:720-1490(-)